MGELFVRWMQFSIFQSITRVHGDRNPKGSKYTGAPLSTQCDPTGASGGPVEPWAYGPAGVDALNLTRQALALKESLKPYLMAQLDQLSEHGQPLMRSLWFDFPDDKAAMEVPDQFMWGPDYMVALVLEAGATERHVLFPKRNGCTFTHHFSGKVYQGGGNVSVPVPSLASFPLFKVACGSALGASAAGPADSQRVTIAPGVEMPFVNLGGVAGSAHRSNYSAFLAVGGRGLDTALSYGDVTQGKVAAAVKASPVPRSEIFVTTKIPCCPGNWDGQPIKSCSTPEFSGSAAADVALDTKILGKVDLMLLHWPCETAEQTLAAWAELEAAQAAGRTRAIGVSNFNGTLLAQLLPKMKVKPAVNQCGHSIAAHNSSASTHTVMGGGDDTVAFCKEHGISYSAYSPLGGLSGLDVFKDPTVIKVAAAHQVSAAQVALRWLVQQNITVVTAANELDYIKEDLNVFSFALSAQEMRTLAAL